MNKKLDLFEPQMQLEEIEKLQGERKWSQLCDAIIASIETLPMERLIGIFLECVGQIHPRSSCEVFLALSEKLPSEEGVKILTIGQEALNNVVLYSENFEVEKASLEIKKCLLLVDMDEPKGIERRLFEWKGLKMPPRVSAMYNLLGFKLYEKIQNIENAFIYLFRYAEICPEENVMDVLVEYALLSKEFFNFTSVTSLPSFKSIKNKDLEKIFVLFREGDVKDLERQDAKLTKIFGENADAVREKVYIIALLNICFAEAEKKISLAKIESILNISDRMSIYIILKSFGLGLIKGWIDGENRILYFNSLVPRTLQPEEISKIRDKFSIWKQRVHEVISILK